MVSKFYPCRGRSISYCLLTFMLFLITIVGIAAGILSNIKEKNFAVLLAVCLFIIHILLVLYSIFKLDARVYLDNEKIFQKQYGKIVEIKYNEIKNIKFSNGSRVPDLLTLYSDNKKISFEVLDKNLDLFYIRCNNYELNNEIKKIVFQIKCGTYKF